MTHQRKTERTGSTSNYNLVTSLMLNIKPNFRNILSDYRGTFNRFQIRNQNVTYEAPSFFAMLSNIVKRKGDSNAS